MQEILIRFYNFFLIDMVTKDVFIFIELHLSTNICRVNHLRVNKLVQPDLNGIIIFISIT